MRPDQQRLVDERFNAETTFWRDANKRRDMFGENYRGRQAILLRLVDSLDLSTRARVLDVGCGPGFLALTLADRGFQVDAIDHAPAMVEMARLQVKRPSMEHRVQVDVGDAHDLSYPDGTFDLIVGLGVVVWLHDLNKGLAEFGRTLKPGGHLVLSVDNSYSYRLRGLLDLPGTIRSAIKRASGKLGLQRKTRLDAAKVHFYSINEFDGYLREAGLEKVKHVSYGFGPFTWDGREVFPDAGVLIHLRLQEYSEQRFRALEKFGSQLVFLAAKNP